MCIKALFGECILLIVVVYGLARTKVSLRN